jgi:hypothetical protein
VTVVTATTDILIVGAGQPVSPSPRRLNAFGVKARIAEARA